MLRPSQRRRAATAATAERADRGKLAEGKVKDWLEAMNRKHAAFAYHRFTDTRAARGKFVAKNPSDFLIQLRSGATYLEVKETKHGFRLRFDALSQRNMLNKFAMAGGRCAVLILFKTEMVWRCVDISDLEPISSGSWDLSRFPTFPTCGEAFSHRYRKDPQ